jgi:hypothetical protein
VGKKRTKAVGPGKKFTRLKGPPENGLEGFLSGRFLCGANGAEILSLRPNPSIPLHGERVVAVGLEQAGKHPNFFIFCLGIKPKVTSAVLANVPIIAFAAGKGTGRQVEEIIIPFGVSVASGIQMEEDGTLSGREGNRHTAAEDIVQKVLPGVSIQPRVCGER